jgi:Domain of Unknown Function with PDB structure (DUF3857)
MMKKIVPILLCALSFTIKVQAQSAPQPTQAFGKIDKADLEMTSCDFEKDANAEILFDKGSVYFTNRNLVFERHVRIKVFNEKAKEEANIRIEYFGGFRLQFLSDVQAETINSNNGAISITKVDKKQMFTTYVDKLNTTLSFAFPDVRPGSIIEYKYTISSNLLELFPNWYFQSNLPTRYSELSTDIPNTLFYKNLVMVTLPYVVNTPDVKALANVPSISDEPFMSSRRDNAQRILYELKSISLPNYMNTFSDTWNKVGDNEADNENFGRQFRRKLTGEEVILNKAKVLNSPNDKIAYIFNEVKNDMKWNGIYASYTNDGTADAWTKKTGNSTEINLILYHLLEKAGVKAFPMLISTRKNGKVNPSYPSSFQFNTTVAYIPIDSTQFYILDATNKYNIYNEVPANLLNGFGLSIDKDNKQYNLTFIQKTTPVREAIFIDAEIKPDGKLSGTAQINSFGYNRIDAVEKYKTDGEEKYIKYLRDGDNNLKISSVKFDHMDVDTLPLTQNIDFDLALTGSDDNYIIFSPNILTGLHNNPFMSEKRFTDIDFGYCDNISINEIYKEPAGFKIDALPKSVTMAMPDNSIAFKRLVVEQDGSIVLRFTLAYKKSLYFKEDYAGMHEFFKKLYEMLNEQIVLKKG